MKFEEKLVKFNGISISPKTGFKNLVFETSRFANGLNVIRGFGESLSEMNLSNIENVMIEFVLKYDELNSLAYIYSLFRALGVLPIENQYLLNKIGTTITQGLSIERLNLPEGTIGAYTKEEIKNAKNRFIKTDLKYLCVVLENMKLTSLHETSNGFIVSMTLSIYKNGLNEEEYKEYMNKFEKWEQEVQFTKIKTHIAKAVEGIKNTSIGTDLKYYDSNALNAIYRDNLLLSAFKSYGLSPDKNPNEKMSEDDKQDNESLETIRRLLGVLKTDEREIITKRLNDITEVISIPNRNLIKVELITHNNISHIPIKGSPLMEHSILGIGKTSFTIQMLFDEYDNEIVQKLKTISDLGIVDKKLEIEHPLLQLFDFYSGQIINIQFNNLEKANGIMVTMTCNVTGYRYSEEATINNEDEIGKLIFNEIEKPEKIFGSYLESVISELFKYRDRYGSSRIKPFMDNKLIEGSSNYTDALKNATRLTIRNKESISFFDLASSYSSPLTSFGILSKNNSIKYFDKRQHIANIQHSKIYLESEQGININNTVYDFYQKYAKTLISKYSGNVYTDFYFFDGLSIISDLAVDIVYSLRGSGDTYNKIINNQKIEFEFLEKIIRPFVKELYNTKTSTEDELKMLIYQKIYEEYFLRLDQVVHFNELDLDFKSVEGNLQYHEILDFNKIYNLIASSCEKVYNSFESSLNNKIFLDRISKEINAMIRIENDEAKNINFYSDSFQNVAKEIKKEISKEWTRSKDNIIKQVYNITLLRIFHLLSMFLYDREHLKDYYVNVYSFIHNIVKTAISSSLFTPIVLRTEQRTDMFCTGVKYVFKSLGESLINYNYLIAKGEERTKTIFLETEFDYLGESYIKKLREKAGYYARQVKHEDMFFNKQQSYTNLIKKDNNYFYGELLPKLNINSLFGEFLYEKDIKANYLTVLDYIAIKRNEFLNSEKFCEVNNDLGNNEDFFGAILPNNFNITYPSKLKSNLTFYDDDDKLKINNLMKTRIIANQDPFKDLLAINKIIKDKTDTLFPDYFIVLNLKDSQTDDKEVYLQLKGLTKLSITKNPITKLKTAIFTVANANKNFFNTNTQNGIFTVKDMKNGVIKSYLVKPGIECRIALGYTFEESYTIFNGIVSGISDVGNTINFTCVNFASVLYNHLPVVKGLVTRKMDLGNYTSHNASVAGDTTKKDNKKIETDDYNAMEEANSNSSLVQEQLEQQAVESNPFFSLIEYTRNGINNLNAFLYEGFIDKEDFSKKTFAKLTGASFSMVTQYMILKLPVKIGNFFARVFKEQSLHEDALFLSNLISAKKDLNNAFGTFEELSERQIKTNALQNIYDIDIDYEAYGIVLRDEKYNPIRIDTDENLKYKKQFSNIETNQKNETLGITGIKEETLNAFSNKKAATIIENLEKVGDFEKMTAFVQPCDTQITKFSVSRGKMGGRFLGKRPNGRLHAGLDISPKTWNDKKRHIPIRAVADGEIIIAEYRKGFGYTLGILHDDGVTNTLYCHLAPLNFIRFENNGLSKTHTPTTVNGYGSWVHFNISIGSKVKAGQHIAYMGMSGFNKGGSHLHFEVFFRREEDARVILTRTSESAIKQVVRKNSFNVCYSIDPELYIGKKPELGILKKNKNNIQPQSNNVSTINDSEFMSTAVDIIAGYEGFVANTYKDGSGHSIGYGFYDTGAIVDLARQNRGITKEELSLYFDGSKDMSKEKAKAILSEIIKDKEELLRKEFDNYDTMPNQVKIALIDVLFQRGSTTIGKVRGIGKYNFPLLKAVELIKQGKYADASVYFDSPDVQIPTRRHKDNANRLKSAGNI